MLRKKIDIFGFDIWDNKTILIAKRYLKEYLTKKSCKGRSYHHIKAGMIYLASKKTNTPLNINELVDKSNDFVRDLYNKHVESWNNEWGYKDVYELRDTFDKLILTRKEVSVVVKHIKEIFGTEICNKKDSSILSTKCTVITQPEDYITKNKDNSFLKLSDEVYNYSLQLIKEYKELNPISVISPVALAGSAVYMANKTKGKELIQQRIIAEVFGCADSTIGKTIKYFKPLIEKRDG